MLQHEESRHDFAFIAGVIVGAISGALATLALTPMSGSETREKIRERAASTDLTPVKERATTLASSAQQLAATSRDKAAGLASKTPLPIGQRQPESGDPSPHDDHPHEPAEGRPDSSGSGGSGGSGGAGGSGPSESGGGGRTPHPSQPAEGRPDIGQPGADRPRAVTRS